MPASKFLKRTGDKRKSHPYQDLDGSVTRSNSFKCRTVGCAEDLLELLDHSKLGPFFAVGYPISYRL
jgi:hypothetical protein